MALMERTGELIPETRQTHKSIRNFQRG